MAYVYRHIRLDKNEPFYIGIGISKNYHRAYSKKGRNKIWKSIINRSKYDVEIIFDDLTWEQACQKEMEFIKLYGRIDNKNGTLSNLTDGGDGTIGVNAWNKGKKLSKKHIESLSKAQTGLKRSKESITKAIETKKNSFSVKGKIVLNNQNGIYYCSVSEAAKTIGKKQSYLSKVLNGDIKTNKTNFIYV
jgi:hypothetical protein